MKIEKIAISLLVNDPNNARKHDKKNIMSIKGSLAKFKQQKPLVVDHNNVVLAGNGTLQAASELGWTEIDIVRSDLEGFNATAYALADNKTSDLSEWDNDVLNATLDALKNVDFDLPAIGFDAIPEFKPDLPDDEQNMDIKEGKLSIVVICKTFDEQENLFIELNERGYKVKI